MSAPWTGSATDRVFACASSAALPAVHETQGGKDADEGHAVHAFIYIGISKGHQPALAWVERFHPALLARCQQIDLAPAFALGRPVAAEVAYAYDIATDTARIVGTNLGRAYGELGPTEIPTTTDIELEASDGMRIVLDAKSGWKQVRAEESKQIRLHGLAMARARGLDGVRVGILQIDDEGRVKPALVDLDDLDLGAFSHDMRRAWERVESARALVARGGVPDVTTGDHCGFCPAFAACPARVALARSVLGLQRDQVAAQIQAMAPDEAGALWERYKAGEELVELIGEQLRAYAEREPLQLPDGRTIEMVPQTQVRAITAPTGETKTITFLVARARGKKWKQARQVST